MSYETQNKIIEKYIWIGNIEVRCHLKPSLEWVNDITNLNGRINIVKGEDLIAKIFGTFHGNIEYANVIPMVITLEDIKYVPNLDYNTLSLTSVMDKRYHLLGDDDEFSLKKYNTKIRLDKKNWRHQKPVSYQDNPKSSIKLE